MTYWPKLLAVAPIALLLWVVDTPALAAHNTGSLPDFRVNTVCQNESTVAKLATLNAKDFSVVMRVLVEEGECLVNRRGRWPAWFNRIVVCLIDEDGEPICAVEVHDARGGKGYVLIFTTEKELLKRLRTGIEI